MSGIIAAVRGMLSTIAEAIAANHVTMNIASPVDPTFSIITAAMLEMMPVSTRAPTMTKSPPKKKRAGHSIFSNISSGDCLLQKRRIAAPMRATWAGSSPIAGSTNGRTTCRISPIRSWTKKRRTTKAMTATDLLKSDLSVIAARSSRPLSVRTISCRSSGLTLIDLP